MVNPPKADDPVEKKPVYNKSEGFHVGKSMEISGAPMGQPI